MTETNCTSCGAALSEGLKFCPNCGAKVTAILSEANNAALLASPESPQAGAVPEAIPTPAPVSAPAQSEKPMGFMGYLLTLVVFALPLIGQIAAFLWAFGKNTRRSRKNLAAAQLIVWILCFAGALAFYILHFDAVNELTKLILS